jgi:hypothetical protein
VQHREGRFRAGFTGFTGADREQRRRKRCGPRQEFSPNLAGALASGLSNSCRMIPNAKSLSSSPARALNTSNSAASARASLSSRVLPMPAAPSMTTMRPSPLGAASRAARRAANSASRSSSGR